MPRAKRLVDRLLRKRRTLHGLAAATIIKQRMSLLKNAVDVGDPEILKKAIEKKQTNNKST